MHHFHKKDCNSSREIHSTPEPHNIDDYHLDDWDFQMGGRVHLDSTSDTVVGSPTEHITGRVVFFRMFLTVIIRFDPSTVGAT